jgi:hypothetical protein
MYCGGYQCPSGLCSSLEMSILHETHGFLGRGRKAKKRKWRMMNVIFRSRFMGGWVDCSHIDLTRRLSTSLRTWTQKNKINQKCNCGIERSELVSGSYGNALLGIATTKGGKKKGRMKNKQ